MCGISGYAFNHRVEDSTAVIRRMNRVIAHRGPDDEGFTLILPESDRVVDLRSEDSVAGLPDMRWVATAEPAAHRVAFGHRRFSIIDVSPGGHQPFWSGDRSVCVIHNGEIYNYVELRRELERAGRRFRTDSDTEVLVESYLEWGAGAFERFNGFWALSLYDRRRRAVLLARDRLGKAPLYIARRPEGLYWSSEIKGIFAAVGTSSFSIRDQSVVDYVNEGRRDLFHTTFYEGVDTFPSAAYAWVRTDGALDPVTYWRLPEKRASESEVSPQDAVEGFRAVLTDAVRIRLRADVPVGFELSGGMDSSALVGLAAGTDASIQAYTVSFAGMDGDEEPYARSVVEHHAGRIRYRVLEPGSDDFFQDADSYVWLLEEPFHSPNLHTNQSTWRAMANAGIRVSINGAAGDEVLAGYPDDYVSPYLRHLLRHGRMGRFAREFAMLSEDGGAGRGLASLRKAYQLLPDAWRKTVARARSRPGERDPFRSPAGVDPTPEPPTEIDARMRAYMGDWRMNYWMRSGNKSAMGVPIEVRLPFLDYRVVECAFRLPLGYLIRDGWLKWVLRQAVKELLPAEVVWRRRKAGYPFPLGDWLRASRGRFFAATGELDCPYLDMTALRQGYMAYAGRRPLHLWRLMALALWWKRCVREEPLG